MVAAPDYRRYWIFQGKPERYDLAVVLRPDVTEPWLPLRSHSHPNPSRWGVTS